MRAETKILRIVHPDNGGPRKRVILDVAATRHGEGPHLIDYMIAGKKLVFAPVLLLSVYGAWLAVRDRRLLLDRYLIAIAVAHWIVISTVPRWWGGHSYGNRYMSDVLPIFAYFMIPPLAAAAVWGRSRRAVFGTALAVLALVSFAINHRGATTRGVYSWNVLPTGIRWAESRLWDWRDLQFMRGFSPSPPEPAERREGPL